MQERTCSDCRKVKVIADFAGPWGDRGRFRYDHKCKPCRKAYNAAHYLRKKGEEKEVVKRKVCSSCEVEKPIKSFGLHPGRTDGRQSGCNQCKAEKQRLETFRKNHSRSFQLPEEKKCGECGEVKPGTEFYRQSAKKDGLASACKACLYKRKNSARRKLNVTEPTVTEKWCPGCLEVLPAADFPKNRRNHTGLWTYCRECEKIRKKGYRRNYNQTEPVEGWKKCPACKELVPTTAYWRNRYEKRGITSKCAECSRVRQRDKREAVREAAE